MMRRIFLDHQSTTPVLPEVFKAMKPFFTEDFGSPSSLHRLGLGARDALDKARAQIAALINAESPDDILFTSGGTESANLAIKGTAYANQRRGDHIVLSATEHPAVVHSVEFLEKQGFKATRVKVDAEGRVDPEAVRAAMTEQTILVCVHHVNHDIGTREPIREIGEIVGERGVPLFVDAVADVQAMKHEREGQHEREGSHLTIQQLADPLHQLLLSASVLQPEFAALHIRRHDRVVPQSRGLWPCST